MKVMLTMQGGETLLPPHTLVFEAQSVFRNRNGNWVIYGPNKSSDLDFPIYVMSPDGSLTHYENNDSSVKQVLGVVAEVDIKN